MALDGRSCTNTKLPLLYTKSSLFSPAALDADRRTRMTVRKSEKTLLEKMEQEMALQRNHTTSTMQEILLSIAVDDLRKKIESDICEWWSWRGKRATDSSLHNIRPAPPIATNPNHHRSHRCQGHRHDAHRS